MFNETGLEAEFKYAGERRILRKANGIITVDVLFTCFQTTKIWSELKEQTTESENFWIPYADAYHLPDALPDFEKDLDCYRNKDLFFEEIITED